MDGHKVLINNLPLWWLVVVRFGLTEHPPKHTDGQIQTRYFNQQLSKDFPDKNGRLATGMSHDHHRHLEASLGVSHSGVAVVAAPGVRLTSVNIGVDGVSEMHRLF